MTARHLRPAAIALACAAVFVVPLLLGAVAAPGFTSHRTVHPLNGNNAGWLAVDLQLVELGGCTYVLAMKRESDTGVSITHHAACVNPAHRPTP